MGNYTGYKGDIVVNKDAPDDVQYMMGVLCGQLEPDGRTSPLLDHPFFVTRRPLGIMCGCSSYFEFVENDVEEDHRLIVETTPDGHLRYRWFSSTKGAQQDIVLLMDWIGPWLVASPGDMLGMSLYEEADWPTVVSYNGPGKIKSTGIWPSMRNSALSARERFCLHWSFTDDERMISTINAGLYHEVSKITEESGSFHPSSVNDGERLYGYGNPQTGIMTVIDSMPQEVMEVGVPTVVVSASDSTTAGYTQVVSNKSIEYMSRWVDYMYKDTLRFNSHQSGYIKPEHQAIPPVKIFNPNPRINRGRPCKRKTRK